MRFANDTRSGNRRLQMFNVRTGNLLSVMDMEHRVSSLASCPEKGLIAIGLERSKFTFKVIQVHLPAKNRDSQTADGSLY